MPLEPVPLILKEMRAFEDANELIFASDDALDNVLFGSELHDERTMNPPNKRLSLKELNVNIRLNYFFIKLVIKILGIPIPLHHGQR